MSEITPAVGSDGSNGYSGLQAKLQALQAAADALRERAEQVAARMRRNGESAATLADLCAAAEVDPRRVAAVQDISGAYGRTAGGAVRLTSAADVMGQAAGHLKSRHAAEYGGIQAAMAAAPGRQAKPGFYRQR